VRTRRANATQRIKIVLVTSALPGEGKTSLAAALSVFATQLQQKTLLVDLDLRHPSVRREFDVRPEAGVTMLATSAGDLGNMVQRNEATKVDILTVCSDQGNPAVELTSPQLNSILQEARARYDWVVIDTPPVLGVTDAAVLSSQVDAVIFVIKWEQTKLDAARAAIEQLKNENANIVGAVLNQVNIKKHARYRFGDEGQYYNKYSKYYTN
jgi:capsular exopolysaccharide synthesis family protein